MDYKRGRKIICIGIDQSYTETGIAINYENGKKLKAFSLPFKRNLNRKNLNSITRKRIAQVVKELILKYKERCEVVIVVERIRQFSGKFISMDYIKSMSGLITSIVDTAFDYLVDVYSVDTRNWKKQIVGTSKPLHNRLGINEKKYPTILWAIGKGYKDLIYDTEKQKYNDNIADAIAISYTFFNKECRKKMKYER